MRYVVGFFGGFFSAFAGIVASHYFLPLDLIKGKIAPGDSHDVIEIAAQIGRLDFVSLLLAFMGAVALLAAFPFARMVQNNCLESTKSLVQTRLESAEQDVFHELQNTQQQIKGSYAELENQAREDIFSDLIPRLELHAVQEIERRIVGTFEDYDDLRNFSDDIGDSDNIAGSQD